MPTTVRNPNELPLADVAAAGKNGQRHRTQYGRVTVAPAPNSDALTAMTQPVHDSYGRRVRYLRISLTDACNLRCVYCMPEHMQFRRGTN